MPYDALYARLTEDLAAREVCALPDGSVDRYYHVTDAAGERIRTREAFLDRLATDGTRSLTLAPQGVRPGGQAVNAARQAAALGGAVHLVGHLDAPPLGPFDFPTVSLGEPATVHVLSFEADDLLLSVESEDLQTWRIEDVFTALPASPESWLADSVLVLQNWVGLPGMTDALRTLAGREPTPATVVFDPGDVTSAGAGPLRELTEALGRLARATDVVVTANDAELAHLAAHSDVSATGPERAAKLRTALGVDAVVRHGEQRAVAATGELTVVENLAPDRVHRRTGAGDRFDGALAAGVAAELSWDERLALANACAVAYLQTGETATRERVRDLLAARGHAG
ncbi:PfkB family carbohydrate kinase [Halosegnis sp.]|uniref:PfkB family carbohydrate kinase n=1 Tax=Halosegnis sp. TaxID=2864959 RepID=UPI0035D4B2B5